MSFFLDWFTTHIAGVIQTLAGLIICVTLVFAYRLFFVKSTKTISEGSEDHPTLDFIEEKLNQLLIQQSALKVTASSMAANGDISAEQVSDITKLKDLLKQKENEIQNLRSSTVGGASAKVASADSTATAGAADNTAAIAAAEKDKDQAKAEVKKLNDQLSLYQTQIDDLKSRLSDYEIIAEDIADLQKFKKENEMLKNQLSSSGLAPVIADVTEANEANEEQSNSKPVLTEEEQALHLSVDEIDLSEFLAEATAEKSEETADVAVAVETPETPEAPKAPVVATIPDTPAKPVVSNSKQDEIDSLFAEFAAAAVTAIAPGTEAKETEADIAEVVAAPVVEETIDTTLTDNEKNLIDDFSKTQKG